MATPLSADTLLRALRNEGLRVVEHRSWRTHNRNHKGPFGPVNGVMIHHTVTSGTASSVELCYNGHSSLPGPLCHGVIAKDGTVYLVGNGRANHAGLGDDDVLRAVIDESTLPADNEANTDGNRHFYGFEAINLGDGKDPWPAAQRDAIVRASAAICRAHGWTHRSVIGHSEWQPGKVDPRTGTGGVDVAPPVLRRLIDERLAHPANWNPNPSEEDNMPLTTEQAAQLRHIFENLKADPWRFKNETLETRDTYQVLRDIDHNLKQVSLDTANLDTYGLTPEQVATLAGLLATNTSLADAIAERVADKLAARLAE